MMLGFILVITIFGKCIFLHMGQHNICPSAENYTLRVFKDIYNYLTETALILYSSQGFTLNVRH